MMTNPATYEQEEEEKIRVPTLLSLRYRQKYITFYVVLILWTSTRNNTSFVWIESSYFQLPKIQDFLLKVPENWKQ